MDTQLHNSSSIRPRSTWPRQRARLALSALVLVGVGAAYGQTPARWIGGSADWSDAGCWDIGVVPNNAGATTYIAIVDVPAQALQISVTNAITISGLVQTESVKINGGGLLTVSGAVTNRGIMTASGGSLHLSNASVNGAGGVLSAQGGVVMVEASTIQGGTLRATDDAASAVRFHGSVTLHGVVWDDPGAGEFQIRNTSAQLLGDFADQLPAGCTLVVWADRTWTASQWTLAGGEFVNDGVIVLRHGGGGYASYPTLHWENSGTLTGTGEVILSGQGDDTRWTGAEGATVTVGPNQWVHGRGQISVPLINEGRIEADLADKHLRLTAGIDNTGTVRVSNGRLTLNGSILQRGTLEAAGGTILLTDTIVDCASASIKATGSPVVIENSTINGGTLRAAADEGSAVRFIGDVTMTGVLWDDAGSEGFQIYNATARLLGDYEHQLPTGYTLLVWANRTWTATQWTLTGGDFVNDGLIMLRHGGGGYSSYPTLHWESSATLTGSGEIVMSAQGDDTRWTGAEGTTLTIGPGQWVHGRGKIQPALVNQGLIEADLEGKQLHLQGGMENSGTALALSGSLTLSGPVLQRGTLASRGGVLRFLNASVDCMGEEISAEGSLMTLENTLLAGGSIRVTDNEASVVRFVGDVTMTDVAWEDPGAGQFQIYNTTARLLGDYANGLPHGYELLVWANRTWDQTQCILTGGDFVNDGLILLRHGGGGYSSYPTLHWENSGTLNGSGEVVLSGQGDDTRWTGEEGVTVTIGSNQWVHGRGELQVNLVNDGLLEADLADKRLRITGTTVNNSYAGAVLGGRLMFSGGLTNPGDAVLNENSQMAISGNAIIDRDLLAPSGARLELTDATMNLAGHRLGADTGIVVITDSSLRDGAIEATDDPASQIRFAGDVTLVNVTWIDPGQGEFMVTEPFTQQARFYQLQSE